MKQSNNQTIKLFGRVSKFLFLILLGVSLTQCQKNEINPAQLHLKPSKNDDVFSKPDLSKLTSLVDRFRMSQLNQQAAIREDFSEEDEFETNEALLFIEAILNNLVYDFMI
ncbi:MAG: hypothetical protein ACK417_07015 [Bacteroidia bacterium]